jgi:CRP/FNR family cyclic AMP-dependent transcriptional regulator
MTDTGDKERLLGSRFLEATSPRVLSAVAEVLETVRVEADQPIITKGDRGTSMYIVAEGRVRVHDGELIFTHLGQGEIFGEMAALDSDVRSASVTAETDSVLYRLEQSSLYRLMSDHTEAAQTIIRTMCRREGNALQVYLRDTAELFDPPSAPAPDLTAALEDRSVGGMGVHLMRTVMDQTRYRVTADRKNELMLTKQAATPC